MLPLYQAIQLIVVILAPTNWTRCAYRCFKQKQIHVLFVILLVVCYHYVKTNEHGLVYLYFKQLNMFVLPRLQQIEHVCCINPSKNGTNCFIIISEHQRINCFIIASNNQIYTSFLSIFQQIEHVVSSISQTHWAWLPTIQTQQNGIMWFAIVSNIWTSYVP